ncbi:MAG: HD-GYP domain-containing protein [Acidobacteria bacterium]|mgnify:CR=1 FL=1|nr:HD-GYP domain-containing protein [Acidobacteriota bacterium]
MCKLTDYVTNVSLVEKTLDYLKTSHGIRSILAGADGTPESPYQAAELPFSKYYPLRLEREIGGLRCSAESEAALNAAEPHILLCVEWLQECLHKEWILNQATNEMLELSTQLHFLYTLAGKLSGMKTLPDYTAVVLREISNAVGADSALAHIQGSHPEKDISVVQNLSETDSSRLLRNNVFYEKPNGRTIAFSLADQTSVLVAPVKEKDSQIGFMAFFRSPDKRFFTAYEKKFLGIIDDIISPTMESLRLYGSLHDLYFNTVKALAAAIDAKDAYTHGHSFRVAKYAVSIGRQMGIDQEKLTDLEIAAYMHDLGKIGVPEAILSKAGKLTPQEFEQIKRHPLITDQILEAIDLPAHIVDAAVQHHERLDGRGYPLGLQGEEISPFARIIAVADVFDALTTTRLYRDAMTVEDALTILYDGIDTEYDKQVVLALISTLNSDKKDTEIAKLYPELKFMKIERMNQFLTGLIQLLLSSDSKVATSA